MRCRYKILIFLLGLEGAIIFLFFTNKGILSYIFTLITIIALASIITHDYNALDTESEGDEE